MANNHTLQFVRSQNKDMIIVGGTFVTSGTTTQPTANSGVGWSVTRSGTGVFTVSLSSSYPALVASSVDVNNTASTLTTAYGGQVAMGPISNTGSFAINTWSFSTGAPPLADPAAGYAISFILALQNTSQRA